MRDTSLAISLSLSIAIFSLSSPLIGGSLVLLANHRRKMVHSVVALYCLRLYVCGVNGAL